MASRPPVFPPDEGRRKPGFDLAMVLLVVISGFIIWGIVQAVHMMRNAELGLVAFERMQKDVYIDADLIRSAKRVTTGPAFATSLRHQTVMVVGRISARRSAVGSGVILRDDDRGFVILTARHVVRGRSNITIVLPDSMLGIRVTRIVMSGKDDLAMLFAPLHDARLRAAAFAKADLQTRDRFVVMGHPGKYSWAASPGVAERHIRHTYLYCPKCDRGDSGGGVFNMQGRLTGIITSKVLVDAPTVPSGKRLHTITFFAVPLDRTRAFALKYGV